MDTTTLQVQTVLGAAFSKTTFTAVTISNVSLSGGSDGSLVTTAQKLTAYQKFQDAETLMLLNHAVTDATHIDNLITIAENRKDAVVFASPERSDVVNVADDNTAKDNVIAFFNGISFIFLCVV